MKLSLKRLIATLLLPAAMLTGLGALHEKGKADRSAVASDVGETRPSARLSAADALDRDAPLVPRNRPDLALYSARSEGEAQTKVFVRGIGIEPRLLYVDPEPGELVEVSDDGTRGVYRRFVSPEKFVYIAIDFGKRTT